ncbi:MAG: FAD-binding oxidoreductase [Deltaproteobacteria bacterium]|nr:FAD-binding oxidoreductase [Deltaproteobacteria bacterium]
MNNLFQALMDIVGEDHISNRQEELFIYSWDLGTTEPHKPDFVVSPRTTKEIQKIMELANREKIPVVPLGGGLSLAGLAVPFKGGILVDLKRMDTIIEVNEQARYALLECGVSQGQLTSYLERNHPHLTHSEPGAPPTATIAGNAAIHGQGDLSQPYGFNSDMINGLEIVLPTGEVCCFGSCSIGAGWFTQHPLPDVGLFLGWTGTTGIITKISLRLFPCKKIRGTALFVVDDEDQVPEIYYKITHTQMCEDIVAFSQTIPPYAGGLHHFTVNLAADSEKELELKQEIIFDDALGKIIQQGYGGYLGFTPGLQHPQISKTSDWRKGGGFEYVGGIMPVSQYPECYRRGKEISERHNIPYTVLGRCIGAAHAMMFSWTYAFNRSDPETIHHAREAMRETDELALELGGTIWKPGIYGQKLVMDRMDPNTLELMKKIKQLLDPNGIMNPGNWEVKS